MKKENENYYFEKDINERSNICIHYKYYIYLLENSDYFDILKNNYGEIRDGLIYCKNCGDYICHNDFSINEGFDKSGETKTNYQENNFI